MPEGKKYALELGTFEHPIELFGAYQVLIRSITESKFSEESFDDRIVASETLADLAEQVIENMDLLGSDLGIRPYGSQRKFLTITSREARPYRTMLRKMKGREYSEVLDFLLKADDVEKVRSMLSVIFSPYQLDDRVKRSFLEDLDHPLSPYLVTTE